MVGRATPRLEAASSVQLDLKAPGMLVKRYAVLLLALAVTGCTSAAGGGGSGSNQTTPIPSGIFYVNEGTASPNTVGAFSTSQISGGGQLSALTGSPFQVTGQNGAAGAPFGIALAKSGTVLYVVNSNQASFSEFTVNMNGTLVLANTYAVGKSPSGICVDPLSEFAAVVNTADNSVQPFAVNADGSLKAASPANANGLSSPVACTYSPDSKYLYVSNFSGPGGISGFSVSSGSGALSPLMHSPYLTTTKLLQGIVAIGTIIFAADLANNGLQILQILANGDLTYQETFTTAAGPIGLAVAPGGKFLYVAAAAKQAVDGYTVNGLSLSPLPGTPYTTGANKTAMVSVNSAGTLLVALDELDCAVTVFAIRSDGTLGYAPMNEYMFCNGANPMAVVAR